jgi:histidine triad (HIT) family protein
MAEQPTPEQIKELQEKMKNMSPEELKELQKQQCIFCQIIDGKVNSRKVYEDDKCFAILDINPANPGHILLMPKEHYPLMPLMPEDVLSHLFMAAKAISRSMLVAVNAEGTNIFVANGTAAGQRAQHFMLHIIPRRPGDNVAALDIPVKEFSKDKIEGAKKSVQSKINMLFKVKPAEKEEIKKEMPKEEELPKKQEEKFITSEKAKRYHRQNCAFAQNIKEEKRIYITEAEAKVSGKKPCTCITGKKIPLKKESKAEKEPKKTGLKEKESEVSLDDIAGLIK